MIQQQIGKKIEHHMEVLSVKGMIQDKGSIIGE